MKDYWDICYMTQNYLLYNKYDNQTTVKTMPQIRKSLYEPTGNISSELISQWVLTSLWTNMYFTVNWHVLHYTPNSECWTYSDPYYLYFTQTSLSLAKRHCNSHPYTSSFKVSTTVRKGKFINFFIFLSSTLPIFFFSCSIFMVAQLSR